MSQSLPSNCQRISHEQRTISTKSLLNQKLETPYFAIYDDAFLDVLGSGPNISLAVEKEYPFAHESPTYLPGQDAVYITSSRHQPSGSNDHTIKVSKVSRQHDGSWQSEEVPTDVPMGNGGINYRSGVLFCAQGTLTEAGGIVYMEGDSPYSTTTLIDSYHGRLFNSVNDLVLHTDGSVWFTDPIYGYEQGFRNKPQLPSQVYRFDPTSGDIRVVADGFGRPNGLCFSPDETTMYVTDTDWIHGDGTGSDDSRPSTIYAFDVLERHGSHFLANKRVFAMADCGIPDGIKCDMQGNVYSGCGDGVNVWSAGATLIGKIMLPGGCANFCFTKKGELAALGETKFWVVKINENRQGALLANLKIDV